MVFHAVTAKDLMDHLMERYGNIWVSNLEGCRQALKEPIEFDCPIDVYFRRVEEAIQLAQYGKMPFTPEKIVQASYHTVNNTGLYSLSLK